MDIKFFVCLISFAFIAETCYGWNQHYQYESGNSEYIHSNDTMVLSLYENTVLKVPAGSRQDLEFIFQNRASPSHFTFSKGSDEDGLGGRLQATEAFLQRDGSSTIRVTGIVIPNYPHGTKATYTLTVSRDSPIGPVKRSAQQGQGGQGGAMGGGGGYNPNGGGGFNPNNGGNRFPNNNNNVNFPDFWNDPSNRREITLQVEFTIVDPDESGDREGHDPWIQAVYAANKKEETCHGTSICQNKWWWVQFTTADSGSGLRKIDMDHSRPTNGGRPDFSRNDDDRVYFRYKKFAVGTDDEVEVVAGTSCCNEHMRLIVTDVDGNEEEFTAKNDKYGESTYVGNLTKTAFWGIVGGGIALVLIIIIVVTWCCVKKYKGYSTTGSG